MSTAKRKCEDEELMRGAKRKTHNEIPELVNGGVKSLIGVVDHPFRFLEQPFL